MLNNFFSKINLTLAFIVIIAVSFLLHINFAKYHFQELDSFGVHNVLNNFPVRAMKFINISYQSDGYKFFESKESVENFLNNEFVDKNLNAILGEKYTDNKELLSSELYSGKSIFFYIRALEILALNKIAHLLPSPLLMSLVLPLSSTYSPGPGFIYGLLGALGTYDDFMKFAGSFHILIFHLGVLMMFFIVSFLSKNRFTALTIGSMMLFSYTLYSYSHNMGSVIWNIFIPIIFIGLLIYYYNKSKDRIFSKISIFSSFLLLFSYLVPYLWLASISSLMMIDRNNNINIFNWSYIKKIIISQKWFIISSLVCLLLILPPSQGFRGSAETLTKFISFFYYATLNFFYFYENFKSLEVVQFFIFFTLLITGFYYGNKRIKTSENKLVWYFIISLLLLYIVSVIFNVLSFIPSRHILFLVAILFIVTSFSIDALYQKIPFIVTISLNIALIIIGFYSVVASQEMTFDRTLNAQVPSYIDTVVVYGENYPLQYRFENSKNAFIKKGNVPLNEQIKPNVRYLYVSQLECSDDLLSVEKKEGMNIIITNEKRYFTNQKFIAFDPSNFGFNLPNNYCQAEFIWKKI